MEERFLANFAVQKFPFDTLFLAIVAKCTWYVFQNQKEYKMEFKWLLT